MRTGGKDKGGKEGKVREENGKAWKRKGRERNEREGTGTLT